MEGDFFEIFYSNLRKELDNEKYVESVEGLISNNKLSKNNYLNLIKEEYHE